MGVRQDLMRNTSQVFCDGGLSFQKRSDEPVENLVVYV